MKKEAEMKLGGVAAGVIGTIGCHLRRNGGEGTLIVALAAAIEWAFVKDLDPVPGARS